ncbi:MAG: hypothetical protein L0241_15825 [Planctomycetia bacterium]|nr:hypothetical protein [Planctomycetia bacterium]
MAPRIVRLAIAIALFGCCVLATSAADVVILTDGFVIQGNIRKETTAVFDKASGQSIPIVKGKGFDLIDEGPKVMVFSSHVRQLGVIAHDAKIRPEYKAYTRPFAGRKSGHQLPNLAETTNIGEFNAKWIRTLNVKVPLGFDRIEQQITHLDPYFIYIVSTTHSWRTTYRTSEWDPKLVRKLLVTHPELAEPNGKVDPIKRIAIAKFMLDVGWIQMAKDELDRLKRDLTGEMDKDAKDQLEKIQKEIERATAELVVREAELALSAGRYQYANDLLGVFPERAADPKDVARYAKAKADLKTVQERYDASRRLLALLIDNVSGKAGAKPLMSVGGGLAVVAWKPAKTPPQQSLDLVAAASQVYAELHQDSAIRVETFVALGLQDEREKAQGKAPTKTPEELLATAISGWVRGKNGATPNVESALKLWSARELILEYQRAEGLKARRDVIGRYKEKVTLGIDELAQIISLLPPVEPEDLENRSGKPVAAGKGIPEGVYRMTSAPAPGHAAGIDYLVKLPPEYHHGRAYPVLIVLTHTGIDAEEVLAPLASHADKHGYILVMPEWTGQFAKNGWEWKGEDHVYVTATLRHAVRKFTVDNDRVFMLGVGEGANMAMDVGMSHPDLFAGVIPMGPMPKWSIFMDYWKNAQKLPFYVVTGEQTGQAMIDLRRIYEKWMPQGFPALMALYKGRGVEWYGSETPVLFDWMGRKTRVNGTGVLQLGNGPRFAWMTMRETDNRFYWLEVNKIHDRNLAVNTHPGSPHVPAEIQGDIRGSNKINVRSRGIKQFTVWLSRDMIDWTKPVHVSINGAAAPKYKPKVIDPNVDVLLEDYYERGDRRMLFLNKLEFSAIP